MTCTKAQIIYYTPDQVCEMLRIAPRTLRRYSALLQTRMPADFDRKRREPGYSANAVSLLKQFCDLRKQNNMPVDRCVEYLINNL
ncbi:MerR family transcriptional regulator [[Phormidium ambiguum] IAM M-71]|uniref:MerR family transcriptional regulator n=1 Tax=[Phormidium ambiguum] IAM M-71 TaxID=454136 RepID=UPI001160F912|nr:MerR family transcriptional regulator [Phormidium ambiguum]